MSDVQTPQPEFIHELENSTFGVIEKPLTVWEKVYNTNAVRKAFILLALAALWQIYATVLNNELMFPTFRATVEAFWRAIINGELVTRAWYSIKIMLMGYVAGVLSAIMLTVIAISSRIGSDLLETLTGMFSPLPAVALLPLALIWFGLGYGSLVFVIIHSVMWAMALNTYTGFTSVSNTLRMVGRNYGLTRTRYVVYILMPAAFPSILTGLKIGWAFAWRTLIAAELVFGVSSGSGGIGWFIYENKNQLEIPRVFAGLFTIILIGFVVETFLFRTIEARTVRKWGMQS